MRWTIPLTQETELGLLFRCSPSSSPDDSVASAASELLHVIEDARNSLVKAGGALAEKERGDIERARANFTRVTQEAIRKRAFRTKFFRWSILSRG